MRSTRLPQFPHLLISICTLSHWHILQHFPVYKYYTYSKICEQYTFIFVSYCISCKINSDEII